MGAQGHGEWGVKGDHRAIGMQGRGGGGIGECRNVGPWGHRVIGGTETGGHRDTRTGGCRRKGSWGHRDVGSGDPGTQVPGCLWLPPPHVPTGNGDNTAFTALITGGSRQISVSKAARARREGAGEKGSGYF